MTKNLTGAQRVAIFAERLGSTSAADFLYGSQGFLSRINFEFDPSGQYQLSVYDVYRPGEQLVVRVGRQSGAILFAFTIDHKDDTHILLNSRSSPAVRQAVELMIDEKLLQFADAKLQEPNSALFQRTGGGGPERLR